MYINYINTFKREKKLEHGIPVIYTLKEGTGVQTGLK
jgi:hypothetical protein